MKNNLNENLDINNLIDAAHRFYHSGDTENYKRTSEILMEKYGMSPFAEKPKLIIKEN